MSEEKRETEPPRFLRSLRKWMIPIIILILVMMCAGLYVGLNSAKAGPIQPIPYSHPEHVQLGIQCLYCHAEAVRSQIAGIPSVEKCMGCHAFIATDSEDVQTLTGYWERGEAIPWQRVNDQPDFVYFSHQPHLGAGQNCEDCHGSIAELELVEAPVRMDMGWCISCHEREAPERAAELADCLVCHK